MHFCYLPELLTIVVHECSADLHYLSFLTDYFNFESIFQATQYTWVELKDCSNVLNKLKSSMFLSQYDIVTACGIDVFFSLFSTLFLFFSLFCVLFWGFSWRITSVGMVAFTLKPLKTSQLNWWHSEWRLPIAHDSCTMHTCGRSRALALCIVLETLSTETLPNIWKQSHLVLRL